VVSDDRGTTLCKAQSNLPPDPSPAVGDRHHYVELRWPVSAAA
jgi:hypothetical protein